MNFGDALAALKEGQRVTRTGWNGKGLWLRLYTPMQDEGIVMDIGGKHGWVECAPYIGIKTRENKFVPWAVSQTDMLANDWEVVT